MQYGTQTPGTGKAVGPLPEGNPIFESNVSNLPYELQSTPVSGAPEGFDPALLAAVIRGTGATTTDTGSTDELGEMTIMDSKTPSGGGDLSYTEMIDVLNSPSGYSDVFGGGYGGGGGGKYYDDFSSQAYAKGGRVRGCNC
jgi:hypothetical protein